MAPLKTLAPYLLALVLLFVAPALIISIFNLTGDHADGVRYGSLIIVNPIVVALITSMLCREHGLQVKFPVMVMLVFFLTWGLIDQSTLPFSLVVLMGAIFGLVMGQQHRKRFSEAPQSTASSSSSAQKEDVPWRK